MHATPNPPVRPLLKWAGGKRQLLPTLATYYPAAFDRYIEPFLGSGAVFFHLAATGAIGPHHAVVLADVNADLIGCYRALRDSTAAVITELAALEREHRARGADCYYEVRDARFNPRRTTLFADRGSEDAAAAYPADLAAMVIFLNRTGFNGLYRLNRQGLFNVPHGRYDQPRICDATHLRQVAALFQRPNVSIEYRAFEGTLAQTGQGDFVYCDPPYAPLSRTASFANYTAQGFAARDQLRLRDAVVAACRGGAYVVLSNSSAPDIVTAYRSRESRAAGLVVQRVPARRAINSRATARGPVDELIVSNVKASVLAAVRPRMVRARLRARRQTA
jgi:DNA adenine methylase